MMKYPLSILAVCLFGILNAQIHQFHGSLNEYLNEEIHSQTSEKNIQNPTFIVDGKTFLNEIPTEIYNLKKEDIKSVSYIGNEIQDLTKIWTDTSKQGVLFINTHKYSTEESEYLPEFILYFFDGKLIDADYLKSVQPSDIESVKVIKNHFDVNEKKYHGMIIIEPFDITQ
ncbi:hypothetical protein [Moheibacter stercoris]